MSELDDLVTSADAGRRLGISRQRIGQLAQREDFPRPLGRVGHAVVYRWSEIEAWAKARDAKVGRPRKGSQA